MGLIAGLVLLGFGATSDARAQHVELTALGGLQFGGSTDVLLGNASLEHGPAFLVIANWRVREDGLFGLSYSRQRSQWVATFFTPSGPTRRWLPVDVGVIHAGGELEIKPNKKLTPILGMSVGATHFSPRDGSASNWFFSAAITGGAKYRITDHIGVRAQMRWIPTVVTGSSAISCSSSGGAACVISANLDGLFQGDVMAGLFVAF